MALHRQCDGLPPHRPTHQWTWSYVHVQLVSLLQWHDNAFGNKQTFELVPIPKPQWACFNGTLNAMAYLLIALPTSGPGPSSSSRATSEPASMAPSVNAMTQLPPSPYPPVDLVKRPCATSEPATMASSKSTSSMSKSTSEPASMARSPSVTSKFMSLFLYRNLNSEPATMTNNDWPLDWAGQRTEQALLCSRPEPAVSLLQWHDHNRPLRWASRFPSSEPATIGISILHKAKEIHSCGHESLKGGGYCYDPSYASMLVAMLMTMLMTMFLAIAGRSSLGYRVVPKPTLFRVSLCSPEPYR